jgi:AcrR family transcriptional regulator
MTTTTRRRGDAKGRITATAAALFYAEGIHAVGVDRVVEVAGVAKATMYQQFASKEALVVACLELHAAGWRTNIATRARARSGTPAARVGHIFDLLRKGFVDPAYRGCPFINTAAEHPDADGPVATVITTHRAEVRDLFLELLAPLPAARRRDCADQLLLLFDGALVGAQHGDGAKIARAAKHAAQRLVESAAAA